MTKTIKLSKDLEEAVDVLKQLEKLSKQFGEAFDELDDDEKNLVGGLVIGVYSPTKGAPGFEIMFGNKIYCQGLVSGLNLKLQKLQGGSVPSLAEMLGKLGS